MRNIYLDYSRRFPQQAQPPENLLLKAQKDLQQLPSVEGKRVLEVGPGSGQLARLMSSAGAMVSALDLVDTYLNQISKDIKGKTFVADIQSPLEAEPQLAALRFDLVTMCDVLEHVVRPGDALISVRELLDPDGAVYVRSPSFETLAKYALRNGAQTEMAHLRTYTPSLLRRELNDAGFTVVASGQFWTHAEPTVFLQERMIASSEGSAGANFWRSLRYPPADREFKAGIFRMLSRLLTKPGEVWALAKPR